jgi:hypothetical protein
VICPTPETRLIDPHGRLTFLWDVDITWAEFEAKLQDPDPIVRGYWPDDVPRFIALSDLRKDWPYFERFLGTSKEMWVWLLASGWTGG